MKRMLGLILAAVIVLSLFVPALASGEASDETSGETAAAPVIELSGPVTAEQAGWMYTEENGVITIIQAPQTIKNEEVILVPGVIVGQKVDNLGNGSAIMANNNVTGSWVLLPEELGHMSDSAVYDFNRTAGWVIPASVDVADTPWLSCSGYVVTEAGSSAAAAAARNGKEVASMADCRAFTVEAGENGTVTPAGTYQIPEAVYGMTAEFTVAAAEGYKIAATTVDGVAGDFKELTQEYTVRYTFSKDSSGISAAFVPLSEGEEETRRFAGGAEYAYTDIIPGAVADGAALPDDLYKVQDPNASVTDYVHSMGVSTGLYYTFNGHLYEQIYCSQASEEVEYLTKAEVINGIYTAEGLVYGRDYDIIRLHNYYANITAGPGRGLIVLYCTYLYKMVDVSVTNGSPLDGQTVYSADNIDHASVFTQGPGEYTIEDLTVYCYTTGRGPSESGNFYGVGSQVHVDGGTEGKIPVSDIHYDTGVLRLINPRILGTNNAIYTTGRGLTVIQGGDIFACSSGGHGPYVSQGGQFVINCDGTNLINPGGSVNITDPKASAIPDAAYASMGQDAEGNNVMNLTDHPEDVTVVVSGLDASTALATDKGGGTIVANQVVSKCYGLGAAGVYTIGSNESWVYVFNSDCTSNLDAALCSASSGYGYAFNSRLQGCMGIKTRASGNTNTEDAGVWVEHCRIAASYDAREEEDAYILGSPDELIADIGAAADIEPRKADETYPEYLIRADQPIYDYLVTEGNYPSSMMCVFVDSMHDPKYSPGSITWWYVDRSKTPGYVGGNKFAVIYSDGSPAVVNVDSCLLTNDNYANYGPESDWWKSLTAREQEFYVPADNLIGSAENGGKLNVTFKNENSRTKWDVTGVSDETCEIVGDFYVGPKSTNAVNATFVNSEWTGKVIYADPSLATSGEMGAEAVGFAYITLADGSVWTVTETCTVAELNIDATSQVIGTVTQNADGSFTVSPAASGEPSVG